MITTGPVLPRPPRRGGRVTLSTFLMLVVFMTDAAALREARDAWSSTAYVGAAVTVVALASVVWFAYLRPPGSWSAPACAPSAVGALLTLVVVAVAGMSVTSLSHGPGLLLLPSVGAVLGALIVIVRPAGRQPRRGQLWMAEVPFEDDLGSKDRPCLVVGGTLRRLKVLYITSQNRDHLPEQYSRIDSSRWPGAVALKQSWIRIRHRSEGTPTIEVRRSAFRRPLGRWDAPTRELVVRSESQWR